ncbi:MAG TPA: methyltransferase domain-containing protein [Opitutaceae bacterium]|nr:methyltransferase domain-containing protein [Opitutaceae bacterium]
MKIVSAVLRRIQTQLARPAFGRVKECCLCHRRLGRFLPFPGGWAGAPPVARRLKITGSDLDRYQCPWCGCNDRERHLWLYLKHGGVFDKLAGKTVLHFAPEPRLTAAIAAAGPARHVQADLFPASPAIEKVDMLAMPYADASFDFVIANHVLEHVADDGAALREIRRILRPGGWAVLQTPYSAVLETTVGDPAVASREARREHYGQDDHVRLFGRDIFNRICAAGFVSRVSSHETALPGIDPGRFGVNRDEPFFLFERR